ncbi:MAG: iron uptake system protein EfeO [Candidatus Limnocylindrales bacterium]
MKASTAPRRVALVALAVIGVGACVPNATTGAIAVTSTDTSCDVARNTATSGAVAFEVTNRGSQVTEFYLMAEDGLRIIGEVENIAPTASRTLTATIQPGSYLTLCKPGMIGSGVGRSAFTVSGDRVAISGPDAEVKQEAVSLYAAFVKEQVAQLLPATEAFVDLYVDGQDDTAKARFPIVRTSYERIEPVAEALGDLDPRIDYREVDAKAEGLEWTGFHRIEKDLWEPAPGSLNSDGETDAWQDWQPSTPQERADIGDQLVADVTELYDFVHSEAFTTFLDDQGVDWLSNGAIALLDEVATGKITGEEDWWSGTDLWDFAANVEGSKLAFALVRDFAVEKSAEGTALVERIDAGFTALEAALATHGNLDDGFVTYGELTDEDKRNLSNLINTLAEPLSQLTSTILA